MKLNSCHNHAPSTGRTEHAAQDGWTEDGRRKMVTVVTHWAPIQCTHLLPESDPGCTNCCWIDWEDT